jgi:hypothetical protein
LAKRGIFYPNLGTNDGRKNFMIFPDHYQEFVASRIDPEIIALNFRSLKDDVPYEYLCYGLPDSERRNDGRLRDKWLKRYRHTEWGGWWCSGVDLIQGQVSDWGCFKPDRPFVPQLGDKTGKIIKYEHPPKVQTGIFALRIPWEIGLKIACRLGLSQEYSQRINTTDLSREDKGFWPWAIALNLPLVLTEGAKKAGSLLSAGYAAIALPGIWNGVRTPKDQYGSKIGKAHLIPELSLFATQGRKIYFAFDCGDLKLSTRQQVEKARLTTAWQFKLKDCQCFNILWDGTQGKGCDDFVALCGEEAFHQAYKNAPPLTYEDDYNQLTHEPHLQLNCRYLQGFEIRSDQRLIMVKSPKGTGKSVWVGRDIIEPILQNFNGDSPRILPLTHRVQLGLQAAQVFGIPYISEVSDWGRDDLFGYGLCFNSLHPYGQGRFVPSDWYGCIVIIDEVEQALWELLSSPKIKYRVEILNNLRQVLRHASRVIACDADLSDVSVNLLSQLVGEPAYIIQNDYTEPDNTYTFTHLGDKDASELVTHLEQHLQQGGKAYVAVSAQKLQSRWSSQALELYFRDAFPNLRILRVDAETVADKEHPAFGCVEHLNEVLPYYDLAIVTSVIETGVSFTVKNHFTAVYGIFTGVQAPNSVRQALIRVRDTTIPRFFFAAERSRRFVGNGATSVKRFSKGLYARGRAIKTSAVHNSLINQLNEAAVTHKLDWQLQRDFLRAYSQIACRVNQGMRDYRAAILAGLANEGHRQIIPDDDEPPQETKHLKEQLKLLQQQQLRTYYAEIAAQDSLDDLAYAKLERQAAKTRTERLQYIKAQLERRYLGLPITPELIAKDDKGWYNQIYTHYLLTNGFEFLEDVETRKYWRITQQPSSWLPDDAYAFLAPHKVRMLKALGIDELFEFQDVFYDSSPLIQRIANIARRNRSALADHFNIRINPDPKKHSNIKVVNSLLRLIGYRLPYLGKRGPRGHQVRYYGRPGANFLTDEQGKLIVEAGNCLPQSDGREAFFAVRYDRDFYLHQQLSQEVRDAIAFKQQELSQETAAKIALETAQQQLQPFSQLNTATLPAHLRQCLAALQKVTSLAEYRDFCTRFSRDTLAEIWAVLTPDLQTILESLAPYPT